MIFRFVQYNFRKVQCAARIARKRKISKFKDGKFSGTLYEKAPKEEEPWYEFSKLGTIKGTYGTHRTGTSGCTVTLKITEIPKNSTISEVFELNK